MTVIPWLQFLVFYFTAIHIYPAISKCRRSSRNSSTEVYVDDCEDEKDVNDDNSTDDRVLSFCPPYTWGANCDQSCGNCSDTCDQDYGVCTHCKPGYKYPFASCTLGCDTYEFGVDCAGSCLRKCGTDCLERVHGTCPANIWYYMFLLFMGLVILSALRIISDLFRVMNVKIRKVKIEIKVNEAGKVLPLIQPFVEGTRTPTELVNVFGSSIDSVQRQPTTGKKTAWAAGDSFP